MGDYRVVDLFAGCGGLTVGFVQAQRTGDSFVPVGAVELDGDAAATYALNFGEHVFVGDIADWLAGPLPEADVVVGGPPCQGFSNLGRRNPHDPRNRLWALYVEAVSRIRPAYFVIENVPEFLDSQQFEHLRRETKGGGRLADYRLEEFKLVASHHGAAQRRRRAIVIGRRVGMSPVGEPARVLKPATVRDALTGVRKRVPAHRIKLPNKMTVVNGSSVPGPFTMADLHLTRTFTDVSLRRFAAIPHNGGSRRELPAELQAPCWVKHTSGAADVMGRLRWDAPSVTIRTEFFKPEKGRYLHPEEDRPITHREAALLQGFPAEFRWCGTKVSIARQIGNAVPVPLARAIAESVLDALNGSDLSDS